MRALKIFSAIMIVCVLSFPLAVFGAEFNLKLQSYYPAGMMDAEKQFAERLARESGGRIALTAYSGGELVPSSQILSAVQTGTVDMGRGMGHHFTETPIGPLESGMPMAWTSVDEARNIFLNLGLAKIIADEYAKHGVKYLGPIWAAPYHFLSKRPIKSIADMRKMKIRAVGASAKVLSKLGVKTVSMPPEDIYLALTTGQIDGVLYGSAFEYKETKYYEGGRFFNANPVLDPIVDTLVINQKVWDAMPADLQKVVMDAAAEFRENYYKWITDQDKSAVNELFKNTTTHFSPEDMKQMTQAALTVWDEEAAKSPANLEAVEIIKEAARKAGRL